MELNYHLPNVEIWSDTPGVVNCHFKHSNYSDFTQVVEFFKIIDGIFQEEGKIKLIVHGLRIRPTSYKIRTYSVRMAKKYFNEVVIISPSKIVKSIFLFTKLFRAEELSIRILSSESNVA